MTKAYLVLKTLPVAHLIAGNMGEQLIMSQESAEELDVAALVKTGHLRQMTDAEALAYHKTQH